MLSEAKQNIVVNCSQDDEILKIVPKKPLLSSKELNWDGISLQNHRQPAWETPSYCNIHHSIALHHCNQIDIHKETVLNSHRKHGQIVTGDIIIIPANIQNSHFWNQDLEFSMLFLEPTHIAQIAYESVDMDRVEILPHFATPDPLVYQLCLALNSELELGKSCSRIYVDSLTTALSVHLIRQYSTKEQVIRDYTDGLSKRKLQRAISFINEHLMENLSLKAISNAIEMSPHYFTSLFKQSTGMSAYQYVIYCRMDRAKHLLCRRDLSVAEISQQVGFQNQSHFTNAFRKHTGTTPKMYREAKK
jgi:AraC family transcriptional regulator